MCIRKLLSLLLALCLTAFVGFGCSEDSDDGNSGSKQASGGAGGGGGGGGGVGMCYDENNCEEVPDYGGGDDDPQPGGDKDGKCDAADQCDVENGTRWRCEGNPNGDGQIATGFLCVKGCYKQKIQKKCTKGCFKADTDCAIPGY